MEVRSAQRKPYLLPAPVHRKTQQRAYAGSRYRRLRGRKYHDLHQRHLRRRKRGVQKPYHQQGENGKNHGDYQQSFTARQTNPCGVHVHYPHRVYDCRAYPLQEKMHAVRNAPCRNGQGNGSKKTRACRRNRQHGRARRF